MAFQTEDFKDSFNGHEFFYFLSSMGSQELHSV